MTNCISKRDTITITLVTIVGVWLALVIYTVVFNGVIITEQEMVKRGFAEYNSTTGYFIIKGDCDEQ